MRLFIAIGICFSLFVTAPAVAASSAGASIAPAQPPASGQAASWIPLPPNPTFITSDTWAANGQIYRLYGVQSCLRGTYLTNAHGINRDCGEISLAMLISYVRSLKPLCTTIARTPATHENFVVCVATLTIPPHKVTRIYLGTALIAGGWAFAALAPDGRPFHYPNAVAESVAQKSHAGLWQFPDTPDPNAAILSALHQAHINLASPPAR